MIHIGIDPGAVNGAWAAIKDGRLIALDELPVSGTGATKMISAVLFADQISRMIAREVTDNPLAPLPDPYSVRVIVEDVHAFPGQGMTSAFRFGRGVGIIDGVIGGLNLPMRRVTPAKWKQHFKLPSDKEAARALAIATWPDIAHLAFRRKADADKAEAALLAWYGERTAGKET